jgi:hypothetical protein
MAARESAAMERQGGGDGGPGRRRWRAREIEKTTAMFGPVTEARAVELFGPEV